VDSAINVGVTAYNIDNIGIKAMVKKTAKQTGQTLLEDYQIVDSSQNESQGAVANAKMRGEKDEQTEKIEKKEAKKKDK
jgi:spartin